MRGMRTLAAAALMVLASGLEARAEAEYQWRLNTWVPETSALYQLFALPLVERVRELTDGRIELTPYPTGVITPALQAHQAVLDGLAEAVQAPPILLYSRDPTNAMFSVWPGGMGPDALFHWMFQGGGKELLRDFRRETMGLHSLPSGMGGTELFAHAHAAIRTAEDLDGLKFRALGPVTEVLERWFEAAPTTVPGPEVYGMLERRAIDAAEWSGPGENILAGLHETARYIMYPGPQTYAFFMEFAVKAETWDVLPADLQAKLEAATMLATLDTMLAFEARDIAAWAQLKAGNNEIIRIDDGLIEAFREAGRELAMEKAEGNEWMTRVTESYFDFLDTWLENADFRHNDIK